MPNDDHLNPIFTNILNKMSKNTQHVNSTNILTQHENRLADIEAAFDKIWKEFIRGPASVMNDIEKSEGEIRYNMSALLILINNLLQILEKKKIIPSAQAILDEAAEETFQQAQEFIKEQDQQEAPPKEKPKKKAKKTTKKKTTNQKE